MLNCWEEERRPILKDVSFSILRNQLFLSFHSSLVPAPCLNVIVLTNLFPHFHQQNKLKPILVLQFNPDLSNGSRCVVVEACFSSHAFQQTPQSQLCKALYVPYGEQSQGKVYCKSLVVSCKPSWSPSHTATQPITSHIGFFFVFFPLPCLSCRLACVWVLD